MRKVGDLSTLHDKYFARGFRVVGISSESKSRLSDVLVENHGAGFWIGSDPTGRTLRQYATQGTVGIPRFYLVDSRGKVVGHEVPSAARIETLLDEVFLPVLDRELHRDLAGARRLYERGAYGAAWRTARKLSDTTDADVAPDAQFLVEKVEQFAAHRERQAGFEREGGRTPILFGKLLLLRYQFDGLPEATRAHDELEALRKHAAIKREKRAWRGVEAALKREMKAGDKPYELRRSREMYEKVRNGNERSVPGELAAKRIARLDECGR